MFTELLPMLKDRTVILTISQDPATSNLIVCVTPKATVFNDAKLGHDDKARETNKELAAVAAALNNECIRMIAPAEELDMNFPKALADYATGMTKLQSDYNETRTNLETAHKTLEDLKAAKSKAKVAPKTATPTAASNTATKTQETPASVTPTAPPSFGLFDSVEETTPIVAAPAVPTPEPIPAAVSSEDEPSNSSDEFEAATEGEEETQEVS